MSRWHTLPPFLYASCIVGDTWRWHKGKHDQIRIQRKVRKENSKPSSRCRMATRIIQTEWYVCQRRAELGIGTFPTKRYNQRHGRAQPGGHGGMYRWEIGGCFCSIFQARYYVSWMLLDAIEVRGCMVLHNAWAGPARGNSPPPSKINNKKRIRSDKVSLSPIGESLIQSLPVYSRWRYSSFPK